MALLLAVALLGDAGHPRRGLDPEHCALLQRVPLNRGTCYALAFSPDGRRLIAGCNDGTAVMLACRSWETLYKLDGHGGGVYGVGFSADGRTVATAGARDGTLKLWTAETGKAASTIAAERGVHYRLAFHPGAALLLAGSQGDGCSVWNLADGLRKVSLPGHRNLSYAVAFRPDGLRAATSDTGGTVRIWRTDTWQLLRELPAGGGTVYALAWTRDGRRLISGGGNGALLLWDGDTGDRLTALEGHTGEVRGAAFTPDGRLAVSAADTTVRIWDVERGREIRRLAREGGTAYELAVHPSGTYFAVGGADGAVQVYGRE